MSEAQALRLALERLHGVCKAMDADAAHQGDPPTEQEYQRAMAAAEAALAQSN